MATFARFAAGGERGENYDIERMLISGALALVNEGEARRVTLCGMRHAAEILPELAGAIHTAGILVRIRPRGRRAAVTVEPVA